MTNKLSKYHEKDFSILIDDNDFLGYGAVSLFLTNGVEFLNNRVQGGLQISDTSNSLIDGNSITPNESHGITLTNTHTNLNISNNTICEPTGADRFQCLNNESMTPEEITTNNNTCN